MVYINTKHSFPSLSFYSANVGISRKNNKITIVTIWIASHELLSLRLLQGAIKTYLVIVWQAILKFICQSQWIRKKFNMKRGKNAPSMNRDRNAPLVLKVFLRQVYLSKFLDTDDAGSVQNFMMQLQLFRQTTLFMNDHILRNERKDIEGALTMELCQFKIFKNLPLVINV